jgi:hypothetical protein
MYYLNKKGGKEMRNDCCLVECMLRYVGQTVTIFTSSGGLSGAGFTGVLTCVDCCAAKLITSIGAPPACPIGSSCIGGFDGGFGGGFGNGFNNGFGGDGFFGNPFGSVCVIPIDQIVSFTHSTL